MTTEKFLPYGHQSIDQSDILAVEEALRSDVITRGFSVRTFEEAIASYTGAKYAIAFSNGTTALFAAYQALHASDQDVLDTISKYFYSNITAFPEMERYFQTALSLPFFVDMEEVDVNRKRVGMENLSSFSPETAGGS
ncbi:hypothetical protein ACTFIY_004557 [Dictyostelium cf. discoideum]